MSGICGGCICSFHQQQEDEEEGGEGEGEGGGGEERKGEVDLWVNSNNPNLKGGEQHIGSRFPNKAN